MVDRMFTIVYDLIAMLTQTFTTYVWPTRLKAIKVTASNFLINVFIHLNRQKAGVFDWPLKYSNIRKSVWLEAWSCALTGASSWLLVRHLKIFAGIPQGRGLVRTLSFFFRATAILILSMNTHCARAFGISGYGEKLFNDPMPYCHHICILCKLSTSLLEQWSHKCEDQPEGYEVNLTSISLTPGLDY